ncbi:Multifunctional chaperone (14-3-3 family) [Trachipleistophora hominis]|uniref:Multifunctional chaperone (14-3-3 family) n=1 Tax=Trachipleistophora hominis TaxID=72359 RepID=L7JZL3_TRAHO|nr:Multifunctional chaperone (14-3-3 family) [Trachipleistophora hominis]
MREDLNLDQLILRASLSERAERYEDMIKDMKRVIQLHWENKIEITPKVRNYFSMAFKNLTGTRRAAWRTLCIEKDKYKDTNLENYNVIVDYLVEVENELNTICDDVIGHIDKHILKENEIALDVESQVFFLKMKGDYFRYKAEVAAGQDFLAFKTESKNAYEKASEIANELAPVNSLRLGLCLNYSVFYYEIEKMPDKACMLAKQAFDDAIKDIDVLSEEHYKDSTLIMQLLRDNLSLWTHREESNKDYIDERAD